MVFSKTPRHLAEYATGNLLSDTKLWMLVIQKVLAYRGQFPVFEAPGQANVQREVTVHMRVWKIIDKPPNHVELEVCRQFLNRLQDKLTLWIITQTRNNSRKHIMVGLAPKIFMIVGVAATEP